MCESRRTIRRCRTISLLLGAVASMGMMRDVTDSDGTGRRPVSHPMNIENGDFEAGLAGWSWDFIADAIGPFTAIGQADAMADDSLHPANTVMRLSNSVILPAPQFDSDLESSIPRPGPPAGFAGSAADREGDNREETTIACVTQAEQRFTYVGGDILTAVTSISYGIEMAQVFDLRLTFAMSLENLTTGDSSSTSILDHHIAWHCDGLIALDGLMGWELQQIDVAACNAEPGDMLRIRFFLQAALSNPTPETVVHLHSQALIDDVRLLTPVARGGMTGDGPAGPNRRVLLWVAPGGEFTDGEVPGGPGGVEGFSIETDREGIIDCGDGGDAGDNRLHLGSRIANGGGLPR